MKKIRLILAVVLAGAAMTIRAQSETPAAADLSFFAKARSNGMPALIVPPGAKVTYVPGTSGGEDVVRLSGVQSNTSPSGAPGIYIHLPDGFERAASDHTVKLTVKARLAAGASNRSFAVAYSTSDVGNSGWRKFTLTDQLATYAFTYDVPKLNKGQGDFIGVLPDPEGVDGAVEVAEISAEVILGAAAAAPVAAAAPAATAPAVPATPAPAAAAAPAAPAAAAKPAAAAATAAPPPPASAVVGKGPMIVPATYYDVAVQAVKLPDDGMRGGIAALGKGLIFAARYGRLFYMPDLAKPSAESVVELKEKLPFDLSDPRLDHLLKTTRSVLGVGAEPSMTGKADAWDIYVSMIEFDAAKECISIGLWHAGVSLQGDAEPLFDGPWERIFQAKPCLPLSEFGHEASLYEAGGRIGFDKDGILLTLGLGTPVSKALSPDGSDPTKAYTQLDTHDFGKIIRIDRKSHAVHHISKGHRNVQGLFVDSDGTIFATEHGPQGGDELNLITEGANYGWPAVTFGTQYGKKAWDFPPPADESAYKLPLFSFVPSIGITELVRLKGDEFPRWKGDLMVTSLSGGSSGATKGLSIYRLHYVEGRVIFAEPILLGDRLRDIIEAPDGKLVVLTDGKKLLIISNGTGMAQAAAVPAAVLAEAPAPASTQPPPKPKPIVDVAALMASPKLVAAGEAVFNAKCSSCHGLQPGNAQAIAPGLGCVVGRNVASTDAVHGYSPQLIARSHDLWTVENLSTFITNPGGFAPGTRMVPPEVNADEITSVISFLAAHGQKTCK